MTDYKQPSIFRVALGQQMVLPFLFGFLYVFTRLSAYQYPTWKLIIAALSLVIVPVFTGTLLRVFPSIRHRSFLEELSCVFPLFLFIALLFRQYFQGFYLVLALFSILAIGLNTPWSHYSHTAFRSLLIIPRKLQSILSSSPLIMVVIFAFPGAIIFALHGPLLHVLWSAEEDSLAIQSSDRILIWLIFGVSFLLLITAVARSRWLFRSFFNKRLSLYVTALVIALGWWSSLTQIPFALARIFHDLSLSFMLWLLVALALHLEYVLAPIIDVLRRWQAEGGQTKAVISAWNARFDRIICSPYAFWFFLALVVAYVFPYILLGENAYILIHDNLDYYVPLFHRLASEHMLFAPDTDIFKPFLGGIQRGYLGNGLTIPAILHLVLPPYPAYATDRILTHIVAFLGMYYLLHEYLLEGPSKRGVALFAALCFSILPFLPTGALGIAGLPFVLAALIAIYRKQTTVWHRLIVCVYLLSSSLIFVGVFFLLSVWVFWVYDCLRRRTFGFRLVIFMAVLSIGFLLMERSLVMQMIFKELPASHRSAWNQPLFAFNEPSSLASALENFFFGQYHSAGFQWPTVFLAIGLALAFCGKVLVQNKWFSGLFIAALLFSVLYGLWHYMTYYVELPQQAGFLRSFNFGRFYCLHPVVWHILFALALLVIVNRLLGGWLLVICLIALKIGQSLGSADYNIEATRSQLTYRQFYSPALFEKIKADIGQAPASYRVLSIGMHPAIALYNGFSTLDGYSPNYPLAYKNEFRRIIAKELETDDWARQYYDAWGSRVYVFVGALAVDRYGLSNRQPAVIPPPKIDTKVIYEMGGRYIFSAVWIEQCESRSLKFRGTYTHRESAYRVHVYEVLRPS